MPLLSDRRGFIFSDNDAVFENLIAGDALVANARRVVLGIYEALAAFGAAEEIGHITVEEAFLLPVGRAAVCQCVDIGAALELMRVLDSTPVVHLCRFLCIEGTFAGVEERQITVCDFAERSSADFQTRRLVQAASDCNIKAVGTGFDDAALPSQFLGDFVTASAVALDQLNVYGLLPHQCLECRKTHVRQSFAIFVHY